MPASSDRPPFSRLGSTFDDILIARLSRRSVLRGSLGLAAMSLFGGCQSMRDALENGTGPKLGFSPIPASKADAVAVAPEYTWQVVNAWGDPIKPGAPEFLGDASQSATEQAKQAGMFHDGMHYFPLPKASSSSTHGLIAINYEYTDDNLLSPDGMTTWTGEKVQKSKNAHGLGVFEIQFDGRNGARRVARASPSVARKSSAPTPRTRAGPI